MKPAELAKQTVEKYIKSRVIVELPQELEGIEVQRAGTFVSIKTLNKNLRGCIGTVFPTKNTVIEEIVYNAIAAATSDPRFNEIDKSELDELTYSVDILYPPEPVKSITELDPEIYGIIITSKVNGKKALLLPNLEGVDTVEDQISICRQKAGISANDEIDIQKFQVKRYT